MRYLAPMLVGLCILLAAEPAYSASKQQHADPLLSVLRAIDHVPKADELQALVPKVELALMKIAEDGNLDSYIRRRAITFLSYFPGPDVQERLRRLATTEPHVRVRWMAVYAHLRIWGTTRPDVSLLLAAEILADKEPLVREAVIRGLRHCLDPRFDRLLDAHAQTERDPVVQAAIRRFRHTRTAR